MEPNSRLPCFHLFLLAVVYNAVAIPLAVAGWVTPLVAGVGMAVSSLGVVANALRLLGAPAAEDPPSRTLPREPLVPVAR